MKAQRDSLIAASIAIAVLLMACFSGLSRHAALFRFVVTILCAFLAVIQFKEKRQNWVWLLGAIAVLFNPLVPVRLSRDVWGDVYAGTIAILVVLIVILVKKRESKPAVSAPSDEIALASFLQIYVSKQKHNEIGIERKCQCCGAVKVTQLAVFIENVSYFYARQERRFEGYACFGCTLMTFVIYEARTLLFTWWGLIGLLVGPGYLIWNLYEVVGRTYRFVTFRRVGTT